MDHLTDKKVGAQRIEPVEKETETQTAAASFKPGYRFYMAFSSLALLAMMASLDGTSVSVALPVRPLLPPFTSFLLDPLCINVHDVSLLLLSQRPSIPL